MLAPGGSLALNGKGSVLGLRYSWVGLERTPDGVDLVAALGDDRQRETEVSRASVASSAVEIRLSSPADGTVSYSWRPEGGQGSGT